MGKVFEVGKEQGKAVAANDYKSLAIPDMAIKKALKSKIVFEVIDFVVLIWGILGISLFLTGCFMPWTGEALEKCYMLILIGAMIVLPVIGYNILRYAQIIGHKRIFAKHSQRLVTGEELFIVNEHNDVISVSYVNRDIFRYSLIGWDFKKPEYLYSVKYHSKDETILYVSASRIFLTAEDAERFAKMRKDKQVNAILKENREVACEMFVDPELEDIISIYCNYWDVYSINGFVNNGEYFLTWADRIRKRAIAYKSGRDTIYDTKKLITSDGYYFPIGVYKGDMDFLVDREQVDNFIRFYSFWKDCEEQDFLV